MSQLSSNVASRQKKMRQSQQQLTLDMFKTNTSEGYMTVIRESENTRQRRLNLKAQKKMILNFELKPNMNHDSTRMNNFIKEKINN